MKLFFSLTGLNIQIMRTTTREEDPETDQEEGTLEDATHSCGSILEREPPLKTF
jgi:hypothetical protein